MSHEAERRVPGDEWLRLKCPECGLGFLDFRKAGQLGCPGDYAVFREHLAPLVERHHRSRRHAGKQPQRRNPELDAEQRRRRRELAEAAAAGDYEAAARLRDELRAEDAAHGS